MLSLDQIKANMYENDLIVRLLSEYINHRPRFLNSEMVEALARDCDIECEDAFRILLCAACGLDTAGERSHRLLEMNYFARGLHCLSPEDYRNDAYNLCVRIPTVTDGKWELCTHSYLPYEPFVCNHPILTKDLREIPQIGYFKEEFVFPAVLENGIEWMTVTPNEIETMREPIAQSHGNVVTLGLGLGYYAFHASQKEEVTSVTVVERDPEVISLFRKDILPQFPHKEKIVIAHTDAFDFLEARLPTMEVDYLFADLWHDASDGLDLYLRIKKYEKRYPKITFSYWIEPSLLSLLRTMVFDRITDPTSPLQLRGVDPAKLLSNEFLRTLDLKKQEKE